MRKILLGIIIFLGTLVGCISIFSYLRSKEEEIYALPQNKSYIYEEGRRMSFELYANTNKSYICYPEYNQYLLVAEGFQYTLQNVEVEILPQQKMYLIIISSDVFSPLRGEDVYPNLQLRIINSKYKMEFSIGSLSILNPEGYSLLGVDTYYASYSYMNQLLELVGINLIFSNQYTTLHEFRIGGNTIGILGQSMKDTLLENEVAILNIIPNYHATSSMDTSSLKLESKTYFIPIGYHEIELITQGYIVLNLDGEKYYMDTFNYIVNEIQYEDYLSQMKKGEYVL